MSNTCCSCGKSIGMLTRKATLSDGFVCGDCLTKAGMSLLSNSQSYPSAMVSQLIASRIPFVQTFSATKKIGNYLSVDETHKMFKVGADVFRYDNLIEYDLSEDGETISKGGVGRAVAGGLLFGGVGAVVGGVTGHKASGMCNSMRLRITLRKAHTDTTYINFIVTATKVNSIIYRGAKYNAQECVSALAVIADQNRADQQETAVQQAIAAQQHAAAQTSPVSVADEIMKFKKLLDAGVITQAEFDEQKKQLLGM